MDWSSNKHERAMEIWRALGGMYGARLVREFGEEPPEIWKQAIHRLTDRQVKRGLAALGNQGGDRPPSLPAFVQACKTISATEAASMAPRLEAPNVDRFHVCGQQTLLRFIMAKGGVSRETLKALVQAKNEMVEHGRALAADGEDVPHLPKAMVKRFEAVLADAH